MLLCLIRSKFIESSKETHQTLVYQFCRFTVIQTKVSKILSHEIRLKQSIHIIRFYQPLKCRPNSLFNQILRLRYSRSTVFSNLALLSKIFDYPLMIKEHEHLYQIYISTKQMRLQFQLKKIKIDPVCHVQLVRHAQEFQQRNNIYGQLYGALLDDEAQVTSILPLPDGQKSTKQQLQVMQKKNDDLLTTFNLDSEKIGWYLVCYNRNFWDSLQTIKYYENYINTSFFLVYDFKARLQGKNPYKAFRLKNEFALKENFKWEDLQKTSLQVDNPLQQIPVEVQKNEMFQLLMVYNRKNFLKEFSKQKKQTSTYGNIKKNIEQYLVSFEERDQIQKYFNQNYLKVSQTGETQGEKNIPFNDYSQYIGQALKLDNYERYFKQYLKDNQTYGALFEPQHQ